MPPLPVLSGQDAVRAFERLGWRFVRQVGSHVILTRAGTVVTLSVPAHRELAVGTLRGLIRKAGLTVEQFVTALNQ